jgi:hypothetical protein
MPFTPGPYSGVSALALVSPCSSRRFCPGCLRIGSESLIAHPRVVSAGGEGVGLQRRCRLREHQALNPQGTPSLVNWLNLSLVNWLNLRLVYWLDLVAEGL